MKIDALTANPSSLFDAVDEIIRSSQLRAWRKVSHDKDILYSHTPDQWDEKAMIRAHVQVDRVSFSIAWWTNRDEPTDDVKGVIIGRFTEALMVHFRDYFLRLETSK